MTVKLGVLMDPVEKIHFEKDSTIAMLWGAASRGWEIYYFEQGDLFFRDGEVFAHARVMKVTYNKHKWYDFTAEKIIPLTHLKVILMRKDPPFNQEYIYTTYLLELAERAGVLVVNKPQGLRDANEKMFTTWFPQCCPPTLVTRSIGMLRNFYHEQKDIVCKPLEGMGGASVFRLTYPDLNASVVFEVLTQSEQRYIMAQQFIPEISQGDKRILMINGEPIPFALARVPAAGELRGNLVAGATGVARGLTEKDRWICEQVGPVLREKGLYFVGLDVIGNYLTEINVTSPTCIRELDAQCNLNIGAQLMEFIDKKLKG